MRFEKSVMSILKSLSANFPIINALGYRPKKPIAILVSADEIETIRRILCNFVGPVVDNSMSLTKVGEILCNTNSDFVWLPYSDTRKGREILDFINTAQKIGGVGKQGITALPLVVATGKVQSKDLEDFFLVYVDGELSNVQIFTDDVVPPDNQVQVVLDKISGLELHGKSQEEKALMSAACFLHPALKRHGHEEELGQLLRCAAKLVQQDEDSRDISAIGAFFVSELYIWQEREKFHNILELPWVEMSAEQHFEEIILFDHQYVYMQETLFEEICRKLLEIFSKGALKKGLADCGILCPENSKTYTAKFNYNNIVGQYKRKRALRLVRKKLNQLGELEFVELCLEGGKQDEN